MSKKMEISTVLHLIKKEKVPLKRSRKNKNQLFKKVLDYLKSDYFMFAPLDSFQLSDSSVSTGVEGIEPIKENDKKLLQKNGDYLTSDSYLYGPMVTSQPLDLAATPAASVHLSKGSASIQEETDKSRPANTLDGGSERVGEPGRKTSNVINKVQNTDSVLPTTNAVVRCTWVRTEMVKRMIYQNC